MTKWQIWRLLTFGGVLAALLVPHMAAAADGTDQLRRRVEVMEQELKALKAQLLETRKTAETAKKEARAEENATNKWHLGGYATADFTSTQKPGTPDSFGGGKFNPIFVVNYKDLLQAEGELEMKTQTDGTTKTELEFANLNLFATDWLTITAGKFLSPIGDFQQHLHPDWINKLPDRPAGFAEDGGDEPLSNIGAMVRGAFPAGRTTIDYALFVANGPRIHDDTNEGLKLEGFGGDDNNNKAVGGRIGFRPVPYFTIGVSGMRARIKGNAGSGGGVTEGDYDLEDVDAAYTWGNWDIRGEFIRAHLDSLTTAVDSTSAPTTIPSTNWYNWYLQGAYRLAGITDNRILSNFEPVVRYSSFRVNGLSNFASTAEERWEVGLNYWFAPSLVAKLAISRKNFENTANENRARVQLSYGF